MPFKHITLTFGMTKRKKNKKKNTKLIERANKRTENK